MAIRRRQQTHEVVDALRRIELAAADGCRRAASTIQGDPLTRGAVLAFAMEHDEQAAAWSRLVAGAGEPAPAASSWPATTSATAALRQLRSQAELGVRSYGEAMERLPASLASVARSHRNAWLRHRAWLEARLEAFGAFGRDSVAP